MIPNLMNAKDVAELLGISESKSYSLMQQGVIPSIRIGRSVRVQEEDLHPVHCKKSNWQK